jgi:hypothetical protein
LKGIGLSVFISVHPWPKNVFSGSFFSSLFSLPVLFDSTFSCVRFSFSQYIKSATRHSGADVINSTPAALHAEHWMIERLESGRRATPFLLESKTPSEQPDPDESHRKELAPPVTGQLLT